MGRIERCGLVFCWPFLLALVMPPAHCPVTAQSAGSESSEAVDRIDEAIAHLADATRAAAARETLLGAAPAVASRLRIAVGTAPEAVAAVLLDLIARRRDTGARAFLTAQLADRPEAAVRALGHLGDDAALPEVLRAMLWPKDRATQVTAAIAACRLGSRAGVDVLFAISLSLGGPEVKAAITGLKTCLDESLEVPEKVTEIRTGPYHLQQRWIAADGGLPLRVGPKSPSPALRGRVDELVAAIGSHSPGPARDRHRLLVVSLRAPAASAVCRRFAGESRGGRRREAVRTLIDMGPYALDAVEDALDAEDARGADFAIEVLSRLLVRRRAFPKIATRLAGLESVVLAKLARFSGPGLRDALTLLAMIGTPQSTDPCLALLRPSRDLEIRCAAARALGLLGDVRAREPLFHLTNDAAAPAPLRTVAGMSAAMLGAPQAIGALIDQLGEGPEPLTALRRLDGRPYFGYELDRDGAIARWRAYWKQFATVIRFTPRRIQEESLWALEADVYRDDLERGWFSGLRRDRPWLERVDWETALIPLVPKVTPTLVRAIETSDDPWLRFHAVQLISICGERAGVPALVHALNDPSPRVRQAAAEGLGVIGQAFDYRPYADGLKRGLIKLLDDPDPLTRVQAAFALGRLGFPDGIPALLAAMQHPDRMVSDHAWISFRGVTNGKDFGFRPGASLASRQRAITAARQWWKAEGETFRPRIRLPRE